MQAERTRTRRVAGTRRREGRGRGERMTGGTRRGGAPHPYDEVRSPVCGEAWSTAWRSSRCGCGPTADATAALTACVQLPAATCWRWRQAARADAHRRRREESHNRPAPCDRVAGSTLHGRRDIVHPSARGRQAVRVVGRHLGGQRGCGYREGRGAQRSRIRRRGTERGRRQPVSFEPLPDEFKNPWYRQIAQGARRPMVIFTGELGASGRRC